MCPEHFPDFSPQDEALLEQLLTGERLASESDVRQRLREVPGLSKALVRLRETQHRLDEAVPALSDLNWGQDGPSDGDREIARGILGARLSDPADPESRDQASPRPVIRRLPMAAAILILGGLALLVFDHFNSSGRSSGQDDKGDRWVLSQGAIPLGEVEGYGHFRVPVELGPGDRVVVTVYADGIGAQLLASPPLASNQWNLTPLEVQLLEEEPRIRWTYEVQVGARPGPVVEVFAWLRSSSPPR